MSSLTGIQPIGVYTSSTPRGGIAILQGLVPNPDATPGTGAVGGGGQGTLNTYLDEMSPAAAAQLQVELAAIASQSISIAGSYTVTAGDVTATHATIATLPGTVPPVVANSAFSVRRAGTNELVPDADFTVVGQAIQLAGGGGYALTAGDVVSFNVSQ